LSQDGKKGCKIHQDKMSQRNKMLVWDDCHNSWDKWDVKYIRTKHNPEAKRNMYIGLVSSQRDEMSHCDILPLKSVKK
jgi:hypothetical protein